MFQNDGERSTTRLPRLREFRCAECDRWRDCAQPDTASCARSGFPPCAVADRITSETPPAPGLRLRRRIPLLGTRSRAMTDAWSRRVRRRYLPDDRRGAEYPRARFQMPGRVLGRVPGPYPIRSANSGRHLQVHRRADTLASVTFIYTNPRLLKH